MDDYVIEQCDDDLFEVVDAEGQIVFTGSDDDCQDWVINHGGSL